VIAHFLKIPDGVHLPGAQCVFHHQGVRRGRRLHSVPHGDPGGYLVHNGVWSSTLVIGLPIAIPGMPGSTEVREATILYYR